MKNVYLIFLVGYVSLALSAEPTLGIVTGVLSNNEIAFTINGSAVTCQNYGIVTLDEIEGLDTTCKQRLVTFQRQHPRYRYFSQTHLKRYQQYHLERVDARRCIVYAQGRKSLAELLLEAGLAVATPSAQATMIDYQYQRSVRRARALQKGIYSDVLLRSCVQRLP
ncbi:MAG: hypothetical protein DSZ03_03555 [Sulfurimonas sp.]|nr:MAG: hypothetical protein DSZ03_03555 [Sulfurimonas sp.]